MKTKANKTMQAPSQYNKPLVCEYSIIWPIRDRGIVRLSPTVVTNGDVRSIEYAQQISDTSEVVELIYIMLSVERPRIGVIDPYQHYSQDPFRGWQLEFLDACKVEDDEAR